MRTEMPLILMLNTPSLVATVVVLFSRWFQDLHPHNEVKVIYKTKHMLHY